MDEIKQLIKKYLSNFAFFYRYLGNVIFISLGLSLIVSVLDGFGLSMFLTFLQVIGGGGEVNPEEMGKLRFLMDGMETIGIDLTIGSVLLFMFLFFSFKGVVSFISMVYNVILQQHFIKNIRLDLLNSLNRMRFKKFILSDAGHIQNTMSGEVERVSHAYRTYFSTFQQGVIVIVYMSFAFYRCAIRASSNC